MQMTEWKARFIGTIALLSSAVNATTVLQAGNLAPNSLVITEYLANPVGVSDTQAEYFEIFNTMESAIDLTDLIVRDDGSNEFTISGLLIQARSFAVLSSATGSAIGLEPDYIYGSSMSLTNSDDEIGLFRPDGSLIHKLMYSDGDFFGNGVAHELAILDPETPLFVFGPSSGADFIASLGELPLGNFGTPGRAGRTTINLPETIVPVPAAIWMFSTALSMLGWLRRRELVIRFARGTGEPDDGRLSTRLAERADGTQSRATGDAHVVTGDTAVGRATGKTERGGSIQPGTADRPDNRGQSWPRPGILAPICGPGLERHRNLPSPGTG
jgi:hypothetical protein